MCNFSRDGECVLWDGEDGEGGCGDEEVGGGDYGEAVAIV
jgi:hypothetical protein